MHRQTNLDAGMNTSLQKASGLLAVGYKMCSHKRSTWTKATEQRCIIRLVRDASVKHSLGCLWYVLQKIRRYWIVWYWTTAFQSLKNYTLREGTLGCLWYVHRSKQFFSRSLRSHTRRGPLAHRSSHVRTTKQICPCVICSSNSARYCFGIVYHCSAMVEVLGK